MDFLRGMMNLIPGNGINAKAIRQLTEESKSYNNRNYNARFELNETITITEQYDKNVEIDISHGRIELGYANHKFFQTHSLFGRWKNGFYANQISRRVRRVEVWREGISRLSEKLFNEEVVRFRRAFLSDDPIVHDQIRVAILNVMGKPVCGRCLNERTAGHACA